MVEPRLYQEWLEHIFKQTLSSRGTFSVGGEDIERDKDLIVDLMSYKFVNAGQDLAKYSDAQLK